MTKQEFLEKARSVHGYKYHYCDLSDKINHNSEITISFRDILYTQKVCKHLMGRCPEKNTPKKTTEQFIKEAEEFWGKGKYDYSLTEYKGALKKIKVIYDGVIFEQTATTHLRSSPELNMNQEYFLKKAKDKWGDKYDYSLVEYKNCKEHVKIIYNGVVYLQTPEGHLLYSPENKTETKTTEEFIKQVTTIHNNKYDYTKTTYTLARDKVIITCPVHGDFTQVANSHFMGMGCKKCGDENRDFIQPPKYSTEEYILEARSVWGDKYDYSLTEYVNTRTKVKIIYDGIVYNQLPMGHFKYPVESYLDQEIFLIKAKRKWGTDYDYTFTKFISSKVPIKVIFKGVVYEQLPTNHLSYRPECRNFTRTTGEFIEEANEIHINKYKYDKVNYINSTNKVIITCPIHGDFKQTPVSHLNGSGCPRCNDSFGEREIYKFLNKHNIQYNREHKFIDCMNVYPLRFDFYIPSMRTCIEFDGIQHFQPVDFFGGVVSYELIKINDRIKNDYCEDNYIDLIRIRYDQIDRIEEILHNNLINKIRY